MFGLDRHQYNALKAVARACTKEILEEIKSGKKYDDVAAKIISAHYEKVKPLVSKTKFIWLCGYVQGRWGQNYQDVYE